MANFLTTKGVSNGLEQMMINAREKLVLVTPYVQVRDDVVHRLEDADQRGVKITLIYGKDELKQEEMERLENIKNLSLYFYKDLHAKCYYNEDQMIITSMNLYDFSQRNREMGILVEKDADSSLYYEAVAEVEGILKHSERKREPKGRIASAWGLGAKFGKASGKVLTDVANALADDVAATAKKGCCIKCAKKIDFNSARPYCGECYVIWAKYKKETYTEKYCHGCGTVDKSSMSRPLCRDCYRKQ